MGCGLLACWPQAVRCGIEEARDLRWGTCEALVLASNNDKDITEEDSVTKRTP